MPVKFVAEVIKGLFGISEQSTEETETETNITVERETDEENTDDIEQTDEENTDDIEQTDEENTDDIEQTGEESTESTDTDEVEETAANGEETEGAGDGVGDSGGSEEPVEEIRGIGPTYSERLVAVDIETVGALADAEADEVAEAAEVSESRAADWITQAADQ